MKLDNLTNSKSEFLDKIEDLRRYYSKVLSSLNSSIESFQTEADGKFQSIHEEVTTQFKELSLEIDSLKLKITQETLESQIQTTKAFENKIGKVMYDHNNIINEVKDNLNATLLNHQQKFDELHSNIETINQGNFKNILLEVSKFYIT